jgi:hypothetical protein
MGMKLLLLMSAAGAWSFLFSQGAPPSQFDIVLFGLRRTADLSPVITP